MDRQMEETQVYLLIGGEQVHLNTIYPLRIIRAEPGSPSIVNNYVSQSSANGRHFVSSRLDSFPFHLSFHVSQTGLYDLSLLRSELRTLILQQEPYYLIYSREPGKRFKVRPTSLDFIRSSRHSMTVQIVFDVFLGCAESVETTEEAVRLGHLWQFSQGLVAQDIAYTHTDARFLIHNLGDITVDPRAHELRMVVRGVTAGGFTVENQTTGDRFAYFGTLRADAGEFFELAGVYPRKNGAHCGIDTNGGLITLQAGVNELVVRGLSRMTIQFIFRFLYR